MLYSTISPGKMKINMHWILKNLCTWYILRTIFSSEDILFKNKKYMYVKKFTGTWTWLITWSNPVKLEGLLRWFDHVPNYIFQQANSLYLQSIYLKHTKWYPCRFSQPPHFICIGLGESIVYFALKFFLPIWLFHQNYMYNILKNVNIGFSTHVFMY